MSDLTFEDYKEFYHKMRSFYSEQDFWYPYMGFEFLVKFEWGYFITLDLTGEERSYCLEELTPTDLEIDYDKTKPDLNHLPDLVRVFLEHHIDNWWDDSLGAAIFQDAMEYYLKDPSTQAINPQHTKIHKIISQSYYYEDICYEAMNYDLTDFYQRNCSLVEDIARQQKDEDKDIIEIDGVKYKKINSNKEAG